MSAGPTYPVGTIAKLLMLSQRRVQQLSREGVIPRAERGRYELAPAVQGYIRYLQERAAGSGGVAAAGAPDYHAEKTRKISAEADLAEMEAAERRGAVIAADEVKRAWRGIVGVIRANLLGATPARIASAVIGRESETEIKAVVREEIELAMRQASEGDLTDDGGAVQLNDASPRA